MPDEINDFIVVVLDHRNAKEVEQLHRGWNGAAGGNVLIAYGGAKSEFDRIALPHKILIDDPRLRTRDHQRECQSYTSIFRSTLGWMQQHNRRANRILVVEYDHIPLQKDFMTRLVNAAQSRQADVLAHHVRRIDNTSDAALLWLAQQERLRRHIRPLSIRADDGVVVAFLGTGSLWTHAAFESVAGIEEPEPVYLELWLPTLAHHLGFRVVGMDEQDRWVQSGRDRSHEIEVARAAGAWSLHPVKKPSENFA